MLASLIEEGQSMSIELALLPALEELLSGHRQWEARVQESMLSCKTIPTDHVFRYLSFLESCELFRIFSRNKTIILARRPDLRKHWGKINPSNSLEKWCC